MFKKGISVAPNADSIPKPPKHKHYQPGKIDIWLLGVTTVMGGQYFGWNIGLIAGVYSYIIAYFLVSLAYVAFCWSVSEATGALPFAGGAYGLARCTLGFFPAFLIGIFQILQYIFAVAVAVILVVALVEVVVPDLGLGAPFLMFFCYAFALIFHVRGGKLFWVASFAFGVFGLGVLVLFCFGNLPHTNFKLNAVPYPMFEYINGFAGFMSGLPFATWCFMGVEALNLASDDVANPKSTIPKAQMACIWTLFATATMTLFVTVSLPAQGGIFAIVGSLAPLTNGLMLFMKLDKPTATLLSIPPTYGVAFGFMWAYSRLIKAMAASKLLPPVLARTSRYGTPWLAHVVGSLLGFSVCITFCIHPGIIYYIFPITLLFAFLSYAGQSISYILLRLHYPVMKQSPCKSPLGIPGAVYSLAIWIACIVSLISGGKGVDLIVVGSLTIIAGVYYLLVAKKRQTFSDEENKILLTAHVTRFNAMRNKIKPNGKNSKERPSAPSNNSVPSQRNSVDRRSARASGNHYSVIPEGQLPDMAVIKAATDQGAPAPQSPQLPESEVAKETKETLNNKVPDPVDENNNEVTGTSATSTSAGPTIL